MKVGGGICLAGREEVAREVEENSGKFRIMKVEKLREQCFIKEDTGKQVNNGGYLLPGQEQGLMGDRDRSQRGVN